MKYEPRRDIEQRVSLRVYDHVSANKHFHNSIELVYCLRGKIYVTVGEKSFSIEKDEIAFVPSYFPHSMTSEEDSRSVTFIIPYNFYRAFTDVDDDLVYYKLGNETVNKKILVALKNCRASLEKQPNILVQGYVDVILGEIKFNYENEKNIAKKTDLAMQIMEYIDENSKEKLTLDDLAAHFGYNRYYFSRLFNRTFNCTLGYYISEVRKNKVLAERTKEKKITDLILENGFGTLSSYYRARNRSETETETETENE